jgi:hypothetical protein
MEGKGIIIKVFLFIKLLILNNSNICIKINYNISTLRGYCILFLLSLSPVARTTVVLLAFLLNRGAQKADIRPVYSL